MKNALLISPLLLLIASSSTIAQEHFDQRNGISPAYGSSNVNFFNYVDGNDNRLSLLYFDENMQKSASSQEIWQNYAELCTK